MGELLHVDSMFSSFVQSVLGPKKGSAFQNDQLANGIFTRHSVDTINGLNLYSLVLPTAAVSATMQA